MKDFNNFLEQLKITNATLDYFTDFKKIENNINKISIKLNQLNFLIGKSNLKECIEELFEENPKCFEVLNMLIAVRDSKKVFCINQEKEFVSLDSYLHCPIKIYEYIKETGLEDLFKNKKIKNLEDYVFGIEVGLDTNARKNRGGTQMSSIVEDYFKKYNIKYNKEVSTKNFSELKILGTDIKVFDYIITTKNKTYLIEVNFYSAGGSKLNEVARSYNDLARKINKLDNFEFVWITDGQGWKTAKNKLEEAYMNISRVYNLTTLHDFLKEIQ